MHPTPSSSPSRSPLLTAAFLGFSAVAFGAFGAHGLSGRLNERLQAAFETGVDYHLTHAIVVLVIALNAPVPLRTARHLFTGGIALFSGSLYLMAVTGVTRLGVITPIGGLLLLAGWCAVAWYGWRHSNLQP